MSKFTDYGENQLAEYVRGQGRPSYPSIWYFAPGSAGSDSGITEITGAGLSRVGKSRSLANFAGTQGAGTTLASSGTSKTTSNNGALSFGTPTGSGTLTHVGVFDASSGGNCWMWLPLSAGVPFTSGSPSPLQVAAGKLVMTLGVVGRMSNYLANSVIDDLFRGQAFSLPGTYYNAYYTVAPTDAGGGTEATLGSYARAAIVANHTNLSGTQAPGSTSASSGTGGRVSNNIAIAHPAPSADQGDMVAKGVIDTLTSGNLLWWDLIRDALGAPTVMSVRSGGPAPTYPPDTLAFIMA